MPPNNDRLLLLGYDLGRAEPSKALAQLSYAEGKCTEQLKLASTLRGRTAKECRAAGLDVPQEVPEHHILQYLVQDCAVFDDYRTTEPSIAQHTLALSAEGEKRLQEFTEDLADKMCNMTDEELMASLRTGGCRFIGDPPVVTALDEPTQPG